MLAVPLVLLTGKQVDRQFSQRAWRARRFLSRTRFQRSRMGGDNRRCRRRRRLPRRSTRPYCVRGAPRAGGAAHKRSGPSVTKVPLLPRWH